MYKTLENILVKESSIIIMQLKQHVLCTPCINKYTDAKMHTKDLHTRCATVVHNGMPLPIKAYTVKYNVNTYALSVCSQSLHK